MKRFLLLSTLGLMLFSCSNDSDAETVKVETSAFDTTQTPQELATESALGDLYHDLETVTNPHQGDYNVKDNLAKEGDIGCMNPSVYHGGGVWTREVVMFHKGEWHVGILTISTRGDSFTSAESGGTLWKIYMCCCSSIF